MRTRRRATMVDMNVDRKRARVVDMNVDGKKEESDLQGLWTG
jgi:hypothetical protein